MPLKQKNWEMDDDFAFRNEFKLIDDSYYRVYDDLDYEVWRERVLSLVDLQVKQANRAAVESEEPSRTEEASTIADINPVKPAILDLSRETIYSGLPSVPEIDNRQLNVPWGMKYLLAEVDQKIETASERTVLKTMLMDSRSGRSKWSNLNRVGQEELYPALEKVLIDLRAYTPYCIPFLVKVSKKDVPDYYDVIKKPMDLGTMSKKLKAQEYTSKQQFGDDLNLIYTNCFTYNTAEDSIYRQHVQMLRDKWTYLMKTVPDIILGKPSTLDSVSSMKRQLVSSTSSSSMSTTTTRNVKEESFDDLDSLLNTHLDGLSDLESEPSPKKSRTTSPVRTNGSISKFSSHLREFLVDKASLPARNPKLMLKYVDDLQRASTEQISAETSNGHQSSRPFLFPEQLYFFNSIPDSHLYCQSKAKTKTKTYSCITELNSMYHNYRILQSIRDLRKYLIEGSRNEPPSTDHLNDTIDRFSALQLDEISSGHQSRSALRKIIAMFLSQFGFEMIANAALTSICELVEDYLTTLLKSLRLLGEELGSELASADILRIVLRQASVSSLFDLEAQIKEPRTNKERFNHLLAMLSERVAEVNSSAALGCEVEDSEAPAEEEQPTEGDEAVNDEELEDELNTEAATANAPPEDDDFE